MPEAVCRHAHDCIGNARVLVVNMGDIDDIGVVNNDIVDDARTAPARPVRGADVAASTPPRHHRLAPAERDPAHCGRSLADADRHAAAVPAKAEEGNQRRRIDRADDPWAGCPRPALVDRHPAPIMERCPAPRRGVDPAPAVIRVEYPVAIAVRRPVIGQTRWHPYRAIIGLLLPRAIAVKAVGAVYPGGHIACADGILLRVAAGEIPAIPYVQRRCGNAEQHVAVVAAHFQCLRGTDMLGLAIGAGDVSTAAAPGNEAGAVGIYVQPVIAAVRNGEYGIGGVDFHRGTRRQRAQIKRCLAGGDLELQEIGVVLNQPDLRLRPAAHVRLAADLQFKCCAVARIQRVASGQRGIQPRRHPVRCAGAPVRHLPIYQTKARGREAISLWLR